MTVRNSDIWLKAAVAGSLWASVEIVVGSFLHNLRVPFAGTILAVMGISLMIAFQYKWNDKGLIWRAGLITAIMKSLSPSAVIIGPMLGILTEAVLLDFAIRLFGRNMLGFLTGSIAAVLSALVHKVATIIILYGFNIVNILENVYQYARKQLRVEGPEPLMLVLYLILLYILFGILATLTGMASGRRIGKYVNEEDYSREIINDEFSLQGDEKYSIFLLIFHLLVLVTGLYLVNSLNILLSSVIILPYIVFVFIKYKRSLRRLAKPLFWFQLVLILLFAVLFWNGYSKGSLLDIEGYIIGARMIIRALLVVLVFSAVSVELRNPLVKAVLYKRGFSKLYTSLGLAFSVLPAAMNRIARPAGLILSPIRSLSEIVQYSGKLYNSFRERMEVMNPVFIIAGNHREGKTSFLKETIDILRKAGTRVGGIMTEGIDREGERFGFMLVDVSSDEKVLLCHKEKTEEWKKTGRFYFNPEGLAFGKKILKQSGSNNIMVIDEIGPLELKDGGWSRRLEELISAYEHPMIWVVRRNLTEKIIKKFSLKNVIIMDIARYKPPELADQLLKLDS